MSVGEYIGHYRKRLKMAILEPPKKIFPTKYPYTPEEFASDVDTLFVKSGILERWANAMALKHTARLYEVAVLWHPTEKQVKDDGKESMIVTGPKTVLAGSDQAVLLQIAKEIPEGMKLDQVEVVVRPFA